jgi:hypothetical protein
LTIIKVIEKERGIKLKLRLNSKLMEGAGLCKIIKFVGDKIIPVTPKYAMNNGKKYFSELDSKLMFPEQCKRYSNYIDKNYKHITHHGIELAVDSASRIIKCVKEIVDNEPKLALICGHANLNYYCYSYFLQLDNVDNVRHIFNSDNTGTSLTIGYECQPSEKNIKKKYKLIYTPNNCFNLKQYQTTAFL